jgi:hypothetical protein
MKSFATQANYGLIRKIVRRVKEVSGVSGPNEKNNEESYGSFSFHTVRLLSSRGVDLLLP